MTNSPTTTAEHDLLTLWHSLLGPNPASDNVFDVGDDSLHAARLVVELKRRGYPVTMPMLIEHPTLASLTPVLTGPPAHPDPQFTDLWQTASPRWAGTPRSTLVSIADGIGTPFFFVHWGSGNITFLRSVADRFRRGHPVFGFESIGIRERRRPPLSIPELAELYLTELYRVQPHGPYLLGGICSGCDIAYEMACRITDSGHQVGFLALINGPRPGLRQVDAGWGPADLYNLRLARMQTLTGAYDLAEEMPRMMAVLQKIGYIDDDAEPADFYWHTAVWGALAFAQQHYEPRTYRGHAHVFQTAETAETAGADWSSIAPNAEQTVIEVDNSIDLMATSTFATLVQQKIVDVW